MMMTCLLIALFVTPFQAQGAVPATAPQHPIFTQALAVDNLHLLLTAVQYTKDVGHFQVTADTRVDGVLLKAKTLTFHPGAHLRIQRAGPWRALTIAAEKIYFASGAVDVVVERLVTATGKAPKGATGAHGEKASAGHRDGRHGYPGGDGHNGKPGAQGRTPHAPDLVIVAAEVEFQNPADREKLRLTIRAPGVPGGEGGDGGKGGNGAAGGPGLGGSSNLFKCRRQPGAGGRGGVAGMGGAGGKGGSGGDGSKVFVVAPNAVLEVFRFAKFVLPPGRPGVGGQRGEDGRPGANGRRGSRKGLCQETINTLNPRMPLNPHQLQAASGEPGRPGKSLLQAHEDTAKYFAWPPPGR